MGDGECEMVRGVMDDGECEMVRGDVVLFVTTVFPRSNTAAFIFSRCFEVRRLFEGAVYLRAAFINLSTIMPIVN